MDALVGIAEESGRREIRGVRRMLVAKYSHDGEFQAEQDRLHDRTLLSQPMDDGSGLYEYRLVADVEGRAAIEAAVQALSAPRPVDGEPDRDVRVLQDPARLLVVMKDGRIVVDRRR